MYSFLDFLNVANYFMAGVFFIITGILASMGKKRELGISLLVIGMVGVVSTFYLYEYIEYNIGFISKILIVLSFVINYILFKGIPYSKIFLSIFLGMAILNLALPRYYGSFFLLLLIPSTIFTFIIMIIVYFKKKKNGKNLEEKERKILEYFRERFPEDEIYFSKKLENVEDITKIAILSGVLSSRKLLSSGVKGILLEIVENKDIKLYCDRFEDFLSGEEFDDIVEDEWGVKSLKRKLDKKAFRVMIGIMILQGVIIIGIIGVMIIILMLEEGYYL